MKTGSITALTEDSGKKTEGSKYNADATANQRVQRGTNLPSGKR